jgi:hydroxyacylglutathione hydrolase
MYAFISGSMLQIRSVALPPVSTNAYLVWDEETRRAVLVDAPHGALGAMTPILESEKLTLEYCVLTHAHFDHVLGAAEVRRAGVRLCLHEADRRLLEMLPEQMRLFGIPGKGEVVEIDHWLKDNERLELAGREVEVRLVPGHAAGNVALVFEADGMVFVGDALFAGSVGRTDLPGGSFEVLSEAIRKRLYTLPEETVVYPGHGSATSIGKEKASNPFVRGD